MAKEYIYNIDHNRVRLKAKYKTQMFPHGDFVYLDFKYNSVFLSGRNFCSISDFISNEFIEFGIRKEAKILYDLYTKNKDQKKLIITKDMV